MSSETALLVIDVQVGLMESAYRSAEVLQIIRELLEQARAEGVAVIYVQHANEPGRDLEANTPGWQIHPAVAPRVDELVVGKEAPDAFYQTRLQEELEARGVKRLVLVGAQTECCVDATARRAVTLGYHVLLVSDAHTTLDRKTLPAAQIIAFYNEMLHGFWAGDQVVRVRPAVEVDLRA